MVDFNQTQRIAINIEADDDGASEALDSVSASALEMRKAVDTAAEKLSDTQDELSDLVASSGAASGAMQLLSGRADSAADEVDDLGDQASQTSGRLGILSGSMTAASGSASMMGASTAGAAVALAGLSSVAVPLVATLGAVGTALGGIAAGMTSVIGTGFYAWGKKLSRQNKKQLKGINEQIYALQKQKKATGSLTKAQQKELRQLKKQRKSVKKTTSVMGALGEQFKPVISQIKESALAVGKQFIPLVKDAVGALPQLIKNISSAAGSLKPFESALRELGNQAFETIPKIVGQVMDMARQALPAFVRFGKFILKNAVPALEAMQRTGSKVLPLLKSLGKLLMTSLPAINRFGIQILQVIVPAIVTAVKWFTKINRATDGWAAKLAVAAGAILAALPTIVSLISTLSSVASAVGVVVGALSGPLVIAIGAVAVAVGALWYAWDRNIGNIQGVVKNFVSSIRTSFGLVTDELVSLKNTVQSSFNLSEKSTKQLRKVLKVQMKRIRGILNAVGGAIRFLAQNYWEPMLRKIESVTKTHLGPTLAEFIETMRAIQRYTKPVIKWFKAFWNEWGDEIMTVTKTVFDFVILTVGTALDLLMTTIRVVLNIIQGDWGEAWSAIEGFVDRTMGNILKYLKGSFLKGLKATMSLIIGAIKAPFEALYNWLIGNSMIPKMFNDVIEFIKTNFIPNLKGVLSSAISSAKDIINVSLQGPSIDWPQPPSQVQEWMNGNFNIDWPSNPLSNSGTRNSSNNGSSNNDTTTSTGEDHRGGYNPGDDDHTSNQTSGTNTGNSVIPEDVQKAIGSLNDVRGFATGGIVTSDVIARIGEANQPEAVIPLDRLDAMMAQSGGGGHTTVSLRVEGDDELARLIRENAEIVVEENENNKQDRFDRLSGS